MTIVSVFKSIDGCSLFYVAWKAVTCLGHSVSKKELSYVKICLLLNKVVIHVRPSVLVMTFSDKCEKLRVYFIKTI